jgi:hypothetical protein
MIDWSIIRKRFEAKIMLIPETTCWLWDGAQNGHGYGKLRVDRDGGRFTEPAHRLAYHLYRGSIPPGLVIDHLCRNRWCVNPSHLRVLTNRENILAGTGWSARHSRKTHCRHGHEFTESNTKIIPKGRACKTCIKFHSFGLAHLRSLGLSS